MKRVILLIAVVGLLAGALWLGKTFPAANDTPIDLDLLWIRIPNLQVWFLLLSSISLGAFLGSLVLGFFWLRGAVVNRRYRKIIKRLESEVHQLRSLPLAAEGVDDFEKPPKMLAEGRK